ncbi:Hypothetical protein R9X50_00175800 [Acrodontium crateriforme]|uniref:Uncharacterized protein n=1 Tax=Acrodontium crateriforme TaxID=150365 RepID=A0AAQ3M141_9PEZI|nr:Hypothetical protein R9X50_00175800 [Acrodontium crateriforme]
MQRACQRFRFSHFHFSILPHFQITKNKERMSSSSGCPSGFKDECQVILCLNDWAFDATATENFSATQELDLLCKSPGFGGAYEACGLCTTVYNYSSCCSISNSTDQFNCMAKFVKQEPDCASDLGLITTLSNMLTPQTTMVSSASTATDSATTTGTDSTSMSVASNIASSSDDAMSTTTATDSSVLATSSALVTSSTSSQTTTAASSTAAAASSTSSGAAAINDVYHSSLGGMILLLTVVLRFF